MAVNISLLNSSNTNNINTNFQRVATALQDTVGRAGSSPNQMNADFDLNGNDLLNGGLGDFTSILINGIDYISLLLSVEDNAEEAAASAASAAQSAVVAQNAANLLLTNNGVKGFGAEGDGVWEGLGDYNFLYSGTDDTDAINAAFAAVTAAGGGVVYFPPGTYLTQGNHSADNVKIIGAGRGITRIICINPLTSTQIFKTGAISDHSDFTVGFNGDIDVRGAADTKRHVAFWNGGTGASLCKSSSFNRLNIYNVGTVWYDEGDSCTFSVNFYDCDIRDISWGAVDFTGNFRTQNFFNGIHVGGGLFGRNTVAWVMSFTGEDDEGPSLSNINIESCIGGLLNFENCGSVQIPSIHFEDCHPSSTEKVLVRNEKSNVHWGRCTFYYCSLKEDCSVFGIYNTSFEGVDEDLVGNGIVRYNRNTMSFDQLNMQGWYSDEARTARLGVLANVKWVDRLVDDGPFYFDVEQYTWYSFFTDDDSLYNSFPRVAEPAIYYKNLGQFRPQELFKQVQQISTDFTITEAKGIYIVSAAAGNIVITLPKARSSLSRQFIFKRVDATGNTVTFATVGGDTNGVTAIAASGSKIVFSDGFTTWVGI